MRVSMISRPRLRCLLAALPIALVCASPAHGTFIFAPIGASYNQGTLGGTVDNLINQTGLSAGYTSGVTDFASYTGTTTHANVITANGWTSAVGQNLGVLTFDLGTAVDLDGLGLWNSHVSARRLVNFELFSDTDGDFANGGTTSLGSFMALAPASPIDAQTFSFAATTSQFIHLDIASNGGGGATELAEVAFSQIPSSVPVPSSFAIFGLGAAALGVFTTRRRRSEGKSLASI